VATLATGKWIIILMETVCYKKFGRDLKSLEAWLRVGSTPTLGTRNNKGLGIYGLTSFFIEHYIDVHFCACLSLEVILLAR